MMQNKKIINILIFLLLASMAIANSRVAFSRPSSVLRTPGAATENQDDNILFTAGFASELVNVDLKSLSTSLYLKSQANNGFSYGLSFTTLSDPRSVNEIADDESASWSAPTEIGLSAQRQIYQAGSITVDLGIHDIIARETDGETQFISPSMFAVFSSQKEFEKFSLDMNFGFGSGKVGRDIQVSDFDNQENSEIGPFIGVKLTTPESKKTKNKKTFLFEYDGAGVSLGAKIPITDDYFLSFGLVHANSFGDFGVRSQPGNEDLSIVDDAATICFGFEMQIPKPTNKKMSINEYYDSDSEPEVANPNTSIVYTSSAVEQLSDSLNNLIQSKELNYNNVADSIRFLKFSLDNAKIENTSLLQKISILEDSLALNDNQKLVDIKNYNRATRHISKSWRHLINQEYDKALVEIDKAISINPNIAFAYARKGSIYFAMGQVKKASVNWNIALKLDPEYDEVRDILEAMKEDKLQSIIEEIE